MNFSINKEIESFPFQSQSCFACCSNIGVQIVIVADYWLGSWCCGAKSNLFVMCAASGEANSFSAYSVVLLKY